MLLVRTDWPDFHAYLASLSRPARKNHRAVSKQYADLTFRRLPACDRDQLKRFMELWERQLIRGQYRQWAFPVEHVESLFNSGELELFVAEKAAEAVALHFIQKHVGYWECHPPMYDKTKHPSLAKYMWFRLIEWAITAQQPPLDLGGGPDDWVIHIKERDNYPNGRYKWIYVSERAKRDPDSEPHYYITRPSCKLLLKNS